MSKIELKPCPCCGAEAESQALFDGIDNEINGHIECSKCGLKIEFTIKPKNVVFNFNDVIDGINDAINRWNRRDKKMNENSKTEFTIQEGFVVLDKNSELVEWFDSYEEAEDFIEILNYE